VGERREKKGERKKKKAREKKKARILTAGGREAGGRVKYEY